MLGNKTTLQSEFSKVLLKYAEEKAIELNVFVSIAIVDDGSNLTGFLRMDKSSNGSVQIAIDKAKHAINFQRTTKFHEDVVQNGGYAALTFPGFLAVEGGIPIIIENEYIGAVGISGAQSEQDGLIAQYAIDMSKKEL